MGLELRREDWQAMRAQVAAEAPLEACGLVAGRAGRSLKIYPFENELRSPTRFRIQPEAQMQAWTDMEAQGLEWLAIYHSHPAGPAQPSATDISEAFYPEVLHLIWSPLDGEWDCRLFQITGNQAIQVQLNIVGEPATSA